MGHDATEEQAIAERLKVLVHELQHRTRNLMGVVRGVTDKTLAGSTSLGDFQARFRNRLGALTRVNGLLSRLNEGDRIAFDELLRAELKGHGVIDGHDQGPRVSLRGPKGIRLRSSTVQTLALGLHELATNALKYGALDGPPPRRRGYGRELIERALPYQLRAETDYEIRPEGVHCTITLPLSSTQGEGGSAREDLNA